MKSAGIILCGGQSKRMGAAKATLPFGDEQLLQRVTRIVGSVVSPIVVVASPDQSLPALPTEVLVAHDRHQGQGPLEALAVGLSALPEASNIAFVTGCDIPLLRPAFIERMLALVDGYDAAIPEESNRFHPLCAAYRKAVLPRIETLLADGHRRMGFLIDSLSVRTVSPDEWKDVDSRSLSLRNVNNPADYREAVREAGFG